MRVSGLSLDGSEFGDQVYLLDRLGRLAQRYDQLNYVHPFREGNGRAQRTFWDRIARDAGWYLDWIGVTGDVNDHASRVGSENLARWSRRALVELAEDCELGAVELHQFLDLTLGGDVGLVVVLGERG